MGSHEQVQWAESDTASTSNAKRESERGYTRTRHRYRYKESLALTHAQISSSCSARTLRRYDPDNQIRPPYTSWNEYIIFEVICKTVS